MKSNTNIEETFDTTEELRNLNKNKCAGTSGYNKKRARTIFGTSYGDTNFSEQSGLGTKLWARSEPNFLLWW